jgi:hypothetical protein
MQTCAGADMHPDSPRDQASLTLDFYNLISADTLGDFLGDCGGRVADLVPDQRTVRLLYAATRVILSMDKDDLSAYQL